VGRSFSSSIKEGKKIHRARIKERNREGFKENPLARSSQREKRAFRTHPGGRDLIHRTQVIKKCGTRRPQELESFGPRGRGRCTTRRANARRVKGKSFSGVFGQKDNELEQQGETGEESRRIAKIGGKVERLQILSKEGFFL